MSKVNSARRVVLYSIWIAAIVLLYALHFLHLSADFPNGTPWNDWVKYTDEGWYLNAASRHFIDGQWYVPGDFNPAVALPVWPLLGAALFYFTGVSVVAARALAVALLGITLASTCFFARRHTSLPVALAIISLAVTSPFLYAYTRLAIVEPLLLALFSMAVLLADCVCSLDRPVIHYSRLFLLSLLNVAMLLTKPTAAVFCPAVAYVLYRRMCAARAVKLQTAALVSLVFIIAVAVYAVYVVLIMNSRYHEDFHYLFSVNQFSHPATLKFWLGDGFRTLKDLFAAEPLLAPAAAALLLGTVSPLLRPLWRNTLFGSALLTLSGLFVFVFVRNYQQFHYYLFVCIPLAAIVCLGAAELMQKVTRLPRKALPFAIGILIVHNGWEMLSLVNHPQYTLMSAAVNIRNYIDGHPSPKRLLLAESGDQIALMTGIPAICDQYGTVPLSLALVHQQPGWFAAWNTVDPQLVNEIHSQFHLQRVASYDVMDDPRRTPLVLYRLVPLTLPDREFIVHPQELQMRHRPD